ncbi:MAG: hypothetical protein Q7S58_08305 [Candidatus Binatus sp.]|uniref:hypothetical protein n=1 Tax=Candidatus Binatus sp. TaxID=2811406 RepID=UPI00271E5ABD|nr:hypothetical protein [Candidatus Binatus sp.]MDO8432393.1 hypothetical protein [Candidatus Binatus sp.]
MAARQELIALSSRKDLTPSERRETNDDLCLADFMVGRPTVSLAEQRRTCAAAMSEAGSQSGAIMAQLNEQSRQIDTQQVQAALADRDLAGAERAAMDYRSVPGADPAVLAEWSKDIWDLADEQTLSDSHPSKRNLNAAISELRKTYPDVRHMNDAEFRNWIERTAKGSGTPLASNLELKKSRLKLSIDSAGLKLAALNLDKLAIINDAFAARCGCDAHTDVSVTQSGLPAYIVRLDTETRMSEVMILPHGDQQNLISSAN